MRLVFTVGEGIDQYISQLDSLFMHTDEMLENAVYPGAGVVADAVRSAIESLPLLEREPREFKNTGSGSDRKMNNNKPNGKLPKGITRVEKEGLLKREKGSGMGLAPIRNDGGFVNTKLGFDGYNDHVTPSYPKGHPNIMVARSIESGTSYRQKMPFVEPTVNQCRSRAEAAMKDAYDKEFKKHYKFNQ